MEWVPPPHRILWRGSNMNAMQGFSPGETFIVDWGHYCFTLCRRSYAWMLETRGAAGDAVTWTAGESLVTLTTSNPLTGTESVTPLSVCKLVSISEKMSAAGKRLLVSLDTPDRLPVDVYITCGKDEIRVTVECTRSRPDAVLETVSVLGGLYVEGEGDAVLPFDDGLLVPASGTDGNITLSTWDDAASVNPQLFGPWFGVQQGGHALLVTALSVYANVSVHRESGRLFVNPWYSRDPDARHCDIRIQFPEDASAFGIAKKYRELQITLGGHRTLSQKKRERPAAINAALSGAYELIMSKTVPARDSRWEQLEVLGETIAGESERSSDKPQVIISHSEWVALAADVWLRPALQKLPDVLSSGGRCPIWSVIWRDVCVGIVPEHDRANVLRVPSLALKSTVDGQALESSYRGFGLSMNDDDSLRLSTDGK